MSDLLPTPSQTTAVPNPVVCPNGHDVPPSRTVCGVCGATVAVMAAASNDTTRRPSKLAWATLAILAIAAIAIPLIGDDVLLEDDFTTPEVLQTWPDDGAFVGYRDGAYHLVVMSDGDMTGAYHDVPRRVDGMKIEVDVRTLGGAPVAVVECASDWSERTVPGDESATAIDDVTGYMFAFDLSSGTYAVGTIEDEGWLSSGALPTDGGHRLVVGCAAGGQGTRLTMQTGAAEPVEVVDPDGPTTFRGIGLGAGSESAGSGVAFDNLRVVGAG